MLVYVRNVYLKKCKTILCLFYKVHYTMSPHCPEKGSILLRISSFLCLWFRCHNDAILCFPNCFKQTHLFKYNLWEYMKIRKMQHLGDVGLHDFWFSNPNVSLRECHLLFTTLLNCKRPTILLVMNRWYTKVLYQIFQTQGSPSSFSALNML